MLVEAEQSSKRLQLWVLKVQTQALEKRKRTIPLYSFTFCVIIMNATINQARKQLVTLIDVLQRELQW